MASICAYAMRPDLDLGQSPSDMPGGGALSWQPRANGAGQKMPFPASSARATWPAFAAFGDSTDPSFDMSSSSFATDPSTAAPAYSPYDTSGSTSSDPFASTTAQDQADSAAAVAASGTDESSVWSSIGSGALTLAEAAMKYGPGIIKAAADAGVIPQSQAAVAASQARAAGAVAPVKAPAVGMSAGLAVGGLVAAAGLIYLLTRK